MGKQTEEMVLQTIENESKYIETIENESKYIDIKHQDVHSDARLPKNIEEEVMETRSYLITLELQVLWKQFNYTDAQIKEVVKKYNLHRKGWAYFLDDD